MARQSALQPVAGALGHRRHRPFDHLGVGRLHLRDLFVAEGAGQLARGRRRRRLGHGAQPTSNNIGAQLADIGHEIAAGQHHLHKRRHQ